MGVGAVFAGVVVRGDVPAHLRGRAARRRCSAAPGPASSLLGEVLHAIGGVVRTECREHRLASSRPRSMPRGPLSLVSLLGRGGAAPGADRDRQAGRDKPRSSPDRPAAGGRARQAATRCSAFPARAACGGSQLPRALEQPTPDPGSSTSTNSSSTSLDIRNRRTLICLPDPRSQVVPALTDRGMVGLVLHDELAVHRQHILGLASAEGSGWVLGRQQRRLPGQEPARPVEAELRDQDVLAEASCRSRANGTSS